jgi:hypothetical protein
MPDVAKIREAKEFLVSEIVAEADREGVPLSEIERKMLYFSETGWTLPDIMQVNEEFDSKYNQKSYETKIERLIRHASKRLRKENPARLQSWAAAIRILKKEDHYILVMFDAAGLKGRSNIDSWRGGVLIAIAIGFLLALRVVERYLGVSVPRVNAYYDSYTINDRLNDYIGYFVVAFIVLVLCGAAYEHFDSKKRLDGIVGRVMAPVSAVILRLFGVKKN